MSKSNLVRGLHGLFNANSVESITLMDNGVGVINAQGQMIHWVKETDPTKAQKVAKALTDAVMDATPIDWKSLGY